MIELRKSKPEEVPELQELFRLCFGDGPEVSGLYFNHFYSPEEFLILREEGEAQPCRPRGEGTAAGPEVGPDFG